MKKIASYVDGFTDGYDDLCGRYVDYSEDDVPFTYNVIPSGFSDTYIVVTEDPIDLLTVAHMTTEGVKQLFSNTIQM